MNKDRRKQLKNAIDKLQDVVYLLNDVKDDEDFAFNNLPEGLQCSMRGQDMEENINELEESVDAIGDVINVLDSIIYK